MTTPLVVTGALICNGRILLQQRSRRRSYCWMWETPGGKVEDNEISTEAVIREWREEVDLPVFVSMALGRKEFRVPDVERDFDMVAYLLLSEVPDPLIVKNDGEGLGWFTLAEASGLKGTPSLKWLLSLVSYNRLM